MGKEPSALVSASFGSMIAIGILSSNWKHRESALSHILCSLIKPALQDCEGNDFDNAIKSTCILIAETCQDKVVKVFSQSIELFQFLISSPILEEKGIETFVRAVTDLDIVGKMLVKSEDGSGRSVGKVHDVLLDFSFHPGIGEGFAASYLVSRI